MRSCISKYIWRAGTMSLLNHIVFRRLLCVIWFKNWYSNLKQLVQSIVFIIIYLSLQLNWIADCICEFSKPLDFVGTLHNKCIRSNALKILSNILIWYYNSTCRSLAFCNKNDLSVETQGPFKDVICLFVFLNTILGTIFDQRRSLLTFIMSLACFLGLNMSLKSIQKFQRLFTHVKL